MSEQKIINGVNVSDLFETIEHVKGKPELAKFTFRVGNRWLEGGHNRTSINEFDGACQRHARRRPFVLDADEPPVLLGEDRGANPVEYALTALAACVTTGIVFHAAARGIRLKRVESQLEGFIDLQGFLGIDPNVRNGYEGVRMTFHIEADASESELEEICALGPTFSPVYDIFTNKVPVTVELAKKEAPAKRIA
ncbi:MAG: OsmC family protein [Acidobacteria bacterium]|nr:OsmC family protein [Acidobacteriota bacterium]